MNGLEAIELMKQGKMIESNDFFTRYIKDGVMYSVTPKGDVVSNDFDINYENYREYTPKSLIGWERVDKEQTYYYISGLNAPNDIIEANEEVDKMTYEKANYFSTKEKAEEINFKQTLFRKLQRFSDENGGNEIDWNKSSQDKCVIRFDYEKDECYVGFNYVGFNCYTRNFGQVYFISAEIAKQAIELFHDDLIKYFTM